MFKTTTIQGVKLVAALMVAALAGCAQVEAEVPAAQVTQKGVAFYGMDSGAWSGEVSGTQSFTLSSDNLSWVKDLNSKVYLTEIDLRATSGVMDLGFVHFAHVTMADADQAGQTVELVEYTRPEAYTPSPLLVAPTPYPIDLSLIWTAKRILVTLTVAGVLPEAAWTVDVTLHLSGTISYKL
jgi:hypothetical protein